MPTQKPTRTELSLTNLALARPRQTPEPEQVVSASTDIIVPEPTPHIAPEQAPATSGSGDKKLQSSQITDLKTLESVTNPDGEVFKPGDRIQVQAPWGESAIAEIVTLYQDSSGSDWVSYLPFEVSPPNNWSWLSGCIRASLLVKSS